MLVSRDYDIIEQASWMACVPLSLWAPIYVVVLSSSGIAMLVVLFLDHFSCFLENYGSVILFADGAFCI